MPHLIERLPFHMAVGISYIAPFRDQIARCSPGKRPFGQMVRGVGNSYLRIDPP